jgi:hypothetical protein
VPTKAQLRKLANGLGALEAAEFAAARARASKTEAGWLLGWLEAVLVPLTEGGWLDHAELRCYFWGWWRSLQIVAGVVSSGTAIPAVERVAPGMGGGVGRWLLAWHEVDGGPTWNPFGPVTLLELRHAAGHGERADHLWRPLGEPWSAGFPVDSATWPDDLRAAVQRRGCLPPPDPPPFDWRDVPGPHEPLDHHPEGLSLPPEWAAWRARIAATRAASTSMGRRQT